jgi:dihydrofolate reductase
MSERRVILYISMSLDGFIATGDDDLSWLRRVEKEGEDYGYEEFSNSVDTYIVGRKTYEIIRKLTGGSFPQAEKYDCYVITRKDRPGEKGITFYNGDVEALIAKLKSEPGKHIYCDGGGELVSLLMQKDLIDEYIISVIPVILGSGIRLFQGDTPGFALKSLTARHFETGLVQLHYQRKRHP